MTKKLHKKSSMTLKDFYETTPGQLPLGTRLPSKPGHSNRDEYEDVATLEKDIAGLSTGSSVTHKPSKDVHYSSYGPQVPCSADLYSPYVGKYNAANGYDRDSCEGPHGAPHGAEYAYGGYDQHYGRTGQTAYGQVRGMYGAETDVYGGGRTERGYNEQYRFSKGGPYHPEYLPPPPPPPPPRNDMQVAYAEERSYVSLSRESSERHSALVGEVANGEFVPRYVPPPPPPPPAPRNVVAVAQGVSSKASSPPAGPPAERPAMNGYSVEGAKGAVVKGTLQNGVLAVPPVATKGGLRQEGTAVVAPCTPDLPLNRGTKKESPTESPERKVQSGSHVAHRVSTGKNEWADKMAQAVMAKMGTVKSSLLAGAPNVPPPAPQQDEGPAILKPNHPFERPRLVLKPRAEPLATDRDAAGGESENSAARPKLNLLPRTKPLEELAVAPKEPERPKLNLLPRSKPLPAVNTSQVDPDDHEKWSSGKDNGRPVVSLLPRSKPVGDTGSAKEETRTRSSNPFGAAKPREEVLKERGVIPQVDTPAAVSRSASVVSGTSTEDDWQMVSRGKVQAKVMGAVNPDEDGISGAVSRPRAVPGRAHHYQHHQANGLGHVGSHDSGYGNGHGFGSLGGHSYGSPSGPAGIGGYDDDEAMDFNIRRALPTRESLF